MTPRKTKHYVITNHKVLSPIEQDHLITVCTRQFKMDPGNRDSLMILIAFECGLRAQELLNVRIMDFNPTPGSLFIRSLKGSNPRELPLKHRRAIELKQLILSQCRANSWNELDPDALIFDISYQRFYQIWEFYRPNPKKTLHCLRHTFAVNLYTRTKDIKAVQLALGHRNIQNTMVYVDFVYSQDVLRKLMHG